MGKRTFTNVQCVVVALGVGFLLGMVTGQSQAKFTPASDSAALTTEIALLRVEGGKAQVAYKDAMAQLKAWQNAKLQLLPAMGASTENLEKFNGRMMEVLPTSFPFTLSLRVEGVPSDRLLAVTSRSGQSWVVKAIDDLVLLQQSK